MIGDQNNRRDAHQDFDPDQLIHLMKNWINLLQISAEWATLEVSKLEKDFLFWVIIKLNAFILQGYI